MTSENTGFTKIICRSFIAVLLMLNGCTGGGGDSFASNGGIGGTGVSFGAVDGFASIIINGTEFSTAGAVFTENGGPAIQADYEVGYVVRAEVNFANNTASRVDYAETVRGPVQAVDFVNRTLTVLNQRIIISDETSFDDTANFDSVDFVPGITQVEISGIRTATGQILASYISVINTAEYRVIGWVDNLIEAANTFEIRGPAPRLIVDFSAANQANLTGAIANDELVEVIGPSVGFNAATNTFMASDIEDGLQLSAVVGNQVEVEGIVSVFNSIANFELNSEVINASAATVQFEDGTAAPASALGLNVKIEVEGSVDGNNVLQATRVIIQLDNFIRISALVDATNVAAQTITLLGETVNVTPTTRIEDKSAIDLDQFGLADIMPGNYIEMRGSFVGTNIVASRIEREDIPVPLEVELQGLVEAFVANMSLDILGNTLIVDGGTQYFDQNDVQFANATAFFNAINNAVGPVVIKAEWDNFSSFSTPVDVIEIEDL